MIEIFTTTSRLMNDSLTTDCQHCIALDNSSEDEKLFGEYVNYLMHRQLLEPKRKSVEMVLEYARKA